MMWRDTEVDERRKMEWRWIANVRLPVVAWVAEIKASHQLVTEHLCNDGCTCDRINSDVALNHSLMWADQGFKFARGRAVNQREVNTEVIPALKRCQSSRHRKV